MKWADGDIVIDRNKGRSIYIQGTEKAAQDVAYSLLTANDSVRRIGCGLRNLEQLSRQPGMTKMRVQQEATDAVSKVQQWQVVDGTLSEAERITGIEQIQVIQESPTSIVFVMAVTTATNDIAQLSYRIRLGQQYQGQRRQRLPAYFVTDDTAA